MKPQDRIKIHFIRKCKKTDRGRQRQSTPIGMEKRSTAIAIKRSRANKTTTIVSDDLSGRGAGGARGREGDTVWAGRHFYTVAKNDTTAMSMR